MTPKPKKPCPWCGKKPTVWRDTVFGGENWRVECENEKCHVNPCALGDTRAEAIANWDTRKG